MVAVPGGVLVDLERRGARAVVEADVLDVVQVRQDREACLLVLELRLVDESAEELHVEADLRMRCGCP
jgi:hypothetical protein